MMVNHTVFFFSNFNVWSIYMFLLHCKTNLVLLDIVDS